MAVAPSYEPYHSTVIVRCAIGEETGRRALRAVFSAEVADAVAASPLAATARATAALVRSRIWTPGATPAADALASLAPYVPHKGGEVLRLLRAFYGRGTDSMEQAVPMALRDFYSSIYTWQFIRIADARMHDLCGSALCLTLAVDYDGANDDPGGSTRGEYLAALGEGLACLDGVAAAQALRDMVSSDAFMRTKDAMVHATASIDDLEAAIRAEGGPVSPAEFLRARWWDAAMVPYHRLIMATSAYRHLTNEFGTFRAMNACGRIKRAVDSIIRYNEIVDLLPDCMQRECFNEATLALAAAGTPALRGYADALGAVTDDVLACDCGHSGHQEAAELAMGCCLWYLLVPRYTSRQQLSRLTRADGAARDAYARRSPGTRLRAVATTLRPGSLLHAATWKPLWETQATAERPDSRDGWTRELAHRATRRCLTPKTQGAATERVEALATAVLAACGRLDDSRALHALAGQWCAVFDAAVEVAASKSDTRDSCEELRDLVGRIWKAVVVGPDQDAADPGQDHTETLFTDTDEAVRRTYRLSLVPGWTLRRAFFGVTTSMIELTGIGPYARLTEGTASMCSNTREAVSAPW